MLYSINNIKSKYIEQEKNTKLDYEINLNKS